MLSAVQVLQVNDAALSVAYYKCKILFDLSTFCIMALMGDGGVGMRFCWPAASVSYCASVAFWIAFAQPFAMADVFGFSMLILVVPYYIIFYE